MPGKALGWWAALLIIVTGLTLAFYSGFEARFPDVWPFFLIGGMGLSFLVRYGWRKGIGVAGLVLVILAAVGIVIAGCARWFG
jgi:hypothetical protein